MTRDEVLSELRSWLSRGFTDEERRTVGRFNSLGSSIFWDVPWGRTRWLIGQWPDDEVEVVTEFCRPYLERWPSGVRTLSYDWSELAPSKDGRLGLVESLSHHRDFDTFIARLEDPETWSGVRRVGIMGALEPAQLERVLASPVAARCDALVIGYHEVSPEVVAQVGESALSARLRELSFHRTMMGLDGVRALAGFEWPRLERLDLTKNALGDEGLGALGACQGMAGLRELGLSNNGLYPDAMRGFLSAREPHARLRLLDLRYNEMGAAGAGHVASALVCDGLEFLDIGANEIGDEGVAALANSAGMSRLRELAVEGNHQDPRVTDAGAAALAGSEHMRALERLDLSLNTLTWEAMRSLVGMESLEALRVAHSHRIDLSDPDGIASLEPTAPLHVLDFTACASSDAARSAVELREATWPEPLKHLIFWGMPFSGEMVDALTSSPVILHLRALHLDQAEYTRETLEALARAPFEELEALVVTHHVEKVGAPELEVLMAAPWFDGLNKASLSCAGDEVGESLKAWAAQRGAQALT